MTHKLDVTDSQQKSEEIPALFTPLKIRGTTFRNRIAVSPMCQYSSIDGAATDWHLVHLGSRAVGGAALVMLEATAVEGRGRISPEDMGIWDDKHIAPLARIAAFIEGEGAVPAIQLAHAGRKACTCRPWDGGKPVTPERGAWKPVGASAIAFDQGYQVPQVLEEKDIEELLANYRLAARRALAAGFKLIEIHSAHGYLLHSFLSPLSNQREDSYGGSLQNRMRLLLSVTTAMRQEMPEEMPLFVRISASDWAPGGWDLEQSTFLARELSRLGVDLIDCSSGGLVPHQKIQVEPGYQVPFAETIRREAGVATAAVGMITDARQADEIISSQKAEMVFLARQMLRDPYWALHAAQELGYKIKWPNQYLRA